MFNQLFNHLFPTSQAEEKKSSEVLAAGRAKGLAAHSGRKVGIPDDPVIATGPVNGAFIKSARSMTSGFSFFLNSTLW